VLKLLEQYEDEMDLTTLGQGFLGITAKTHLGQVVILV
jgi:hypothetical protein